MLISMLSSLHSSFLFILATSAIRSLKSSLFPFLVSIVVTPQSWVGEYVILFGVAHGHATPIRVFECPSLHLWCDAWFQVKLCDLDYNPNLLDLPCNGDLHSLWECTCNQ
jgi:hypothetical protein